MQSDKTNCCSCKLENVFDRFVHGIYLILFTWILILLLFFTDVEYACKTVTIIDNGILLLGIVTCLWLSAGLLQRFLKKRMFFSSRKIVFCFTVILFIFQACISYQIYFETGWDPGSAVIPRASVIASGKTESLIQDYFSTYPNNTLLTSLFALLFKINYFFGIFGEANRLMPIILLNCLIASTTCYLIFLILYRFLSVKYAMIGYVFSVILIGLSPWITICYSDMIGLIFPVTVLYLYLIPGKGKWGWFKKYLSILILGYLGYQIKPQTVIIVIAIVLHQLFCFFRSWELKRIKQYLLFTMAIFLCIGGLKMGLNTLYKQEGFVFQKQRVFGMTHFFMMGLNPDTNGIYSGEDVEASRACETEEERSRMNLEVSIRRLKAYGPIGYLRFLSKKMLTNYNDGTFAWSQEGNFYAVIRENSSQVAQFLRNIYYKDGEYYEYFKLVVQGIWLVVLTGCFVFGCIKEDGLKNSRDLRMVLMLAIVGLTVFELLFEARARYLFTYVPIYIVTAVTGVSKMLNNRKGIKGID